MMDFFNPLDIFDMDFFKSDEIKWETADGEKLVPDEMSTEHLKNCVGMLEKRIYRDRYWKNRFEDELRFRDELYEDNPF